MAYASMATRVDTQIATQAANKLLSIRVSNFIAALRSMSGDAFELDVAKPVPTALLRGNPVAAPFFEAA